MKAVTITIAILFAIITGRSQSFDDWDDYYPSTPVQVIRDTVIQHVHDTTYIYISSLDDVTREFGLSFDEYARIFLKFKEDKDTLGLLPTDKIYLNYFLPLVNPNADFINKRMVTREYTVNSTKSGVTMKLTKHPYADSLENTGLKTDCMLTFYGKDNTDNFLKSPSQIKSCMGELFADIYNAKGRIKGVNLYFPDFSFEHKKEMAQLLKSVSLVVDSCRLQPIRGISLYASFSNDKSKNEGSYLSGLTQMVDSIFVLEYATDKNTLPNISTIDKSNAQKLSLFKKLRNQRYMAKFYTDPFPNTSSTEFRITDIYNLLDADYPDNSWETYLFILICIGLVIIAAIVLYLLDSNISYYVNKNIDYVYSLVVMIFLEVLLLLASMFESMSKDNVFTMSSENRYIILLLPLLFIFIVPMMKAVGRRKQLP